MIHVNIFWVTLLNLAHFYLRNPQTHIVHIYFFHIHKHYHHNIKILCNKNFFNVIIMPNIKLSMIVCAISIIFAICYNDNNMTVILTFKLGINVGIFILSKIASFLLMYKLDFSVKYSLQFFHLGCRYYFIISHTNAFSF